MKGQLCDTKMQTVNVEQTGNVFIKFLKKQKNVPKSRFVRNGGIGKLSLWVLALSFLLAFWGSLIVKIPVAVILGFAGLSLLLAVIGVLLGDENAEKARLTLRIFAILAGLTIIGYAIALVVLWKRGD